MSAAGSELLPGVILTGRNSIGSGCTIGPDTYLAELLRRRRGPGRQLPGRKERSLEPTADGWGPLRTWRAGTCLGPAVKAGAFVEMKQVQVGARTQVAHLAYLGDAAVGQDCNIGCGVTTANFDRAEKHETGSGGTELL